MNVLIKNGRVVDPSQGLDAVTDITINDGVIATVSGNNNNLSYDEIIDASGLIVCPGFVDIHAHEDYFDVPEALSIPACQLRMGVTSALCGNCGENKYAPAEYFELAKPGTYLNTAMLAGYGYFREKHSLAGNYGTVTAAELEKILSDIEDALSSGCAGVSFGLEYMPGITQNELSECIKLCRGKIVTVHIRSCGPNAVAAVKELADAAMGMDVRVQISHLASMAGYGQMRETLELIDTYRANGLDICCDCYPYTAYSTTIGSAVYDDGWQELMNCSYKDIEMCEGSRRGQRCTKEIFEFERKMHPDYLTVGHVIKEEDLLLAYQRPYCFVCSDAYLNYGLGHPRAAGSFPKFFTKFVRSGKIKLSDAVNMCSCQPAKQAGFPGKGSLKPGMDADLVIFDLDKISANASYSDPTAVPDGIRQVLIRGETAVRDGKIIRKDLGKTVLLQNK